MSHAAPTVTSRANPRLKQLRAAFHSNARLSNGLVALEGEHLLAEAIRSGQTIKAVFVSDRRPVPAYLPAGVEVLRVADELFAGAVETRSPQGIAALLLPPEGTLQEMLRSVPLLLIAVGLQDPGNLGTLIRSADAFGATGVLTTPGTASPWNQKAMRASAGSVFRIPLACAGPEAAALLKQRGLRLLAAMKDDASAAEAVDLTAPCAVMIGNEGSGLSPDWLHQADARMTIPCPGWVESLNAGVAGSILLYEAARQRSRAGAPR